MRRIILTFLLLFLPLFAFGQGLKTPNSEVEDCVKFLVGSDKDGNRYVADADQKYIKFLSTYAISDKKMREQTAPLVCSFLLHSLVGPTNNLDENTGGAFYPLAKMEDGMFGEEFVAYNRVPFSDTLWYLDIRNYNFTNDAWEKAASLDGYFVTPIVQEQNNGALRLLSGNAVLRMDWFITHVSDTTKQRDSDQNFDLYTNFLFAKVTPPRNVEEWQKLFALDAQKARQIGNESGTIVTKSKAVARHNREMFYYRTELGYQYRTYDVKNEEGFRNYLESFYKQKLIGGPPDVFDAGELFGTNQLGLQVYVLIDGKGNIVNFGDPTVVRHLADTVGDTRVRTAHSCFDCHTSGPLPSENTAVEAIKSDLDLYLYNKEDANRVRRVFLDGKFEESIEDSKNIFTRAIKKTNGLKPELNGQYYLDMIKTYNNPISQEQAAFECGVPLEEFKSKILEGKFGNRLKIMVSNGEPIPRGAWETRGKDGIPGDFQQAMILINGLTTITNEVVDKIVEPHPEALIEKKTYVTESCPLMLGPNQVDIVPKDTIINIIETQASWYKIEYNGKTGWIMQKNVIER